MAENEMPAEQVRSVMTKNIEQAHGAIANYFQLVEKSISASPLGATDQTKTFRNYVERSVAASFGLSDKLLRAKDFQDVLRIQTEFFQTQLKALTEQSKDLCGTATKAASDVTHVPIKWTAEIKVLLIAEFLQLMDLAGGSTRVNLAQFGSSVLKTVFFSSVPQSEHS
jgi:hypothetical protein